MKLTVPKFGFVLTLAAVVTSGSVIAQVNLQYNGQYSGQYTGQTGRAPALQQTNRRDGLYSDGAIGLDNPRGYGAPSDDRRVGAGIASHQIDLGGFANTDPVNGNARGYGGLAPRAPVVGLGRTRVGPSGCAKGATNDDLDSTSVSPSRRGCGY